MSASATWSASRLCLSTWNHAHANLLDGTYLKNPSLRPNQSLFQLARQRQKYNQPDLNRNPQLNLSGVINSGAAGHLTARTKIATLAGTSHTSHPTSVIETLTQITAAHTTLMRLINRDRRTSKTTIQATTLTAATRGPRETITTNSDHQTTMVATLGTAEVTRTTTVGHTTD